MNPWFSFRSLAFAQGYRPGHKLLSCRWSLSCPLNPLAPENWQWHPKGAELQTSATIRSLNQTESCAVKVRPCKASVLFRMLGSAVDPALALCMSYLCFLPGALVVPVALALAVLLRFEPAPRSHLCTRASSVSLVAEGLGTLEARIVQPYHKEIELEQGQRPTGAWSWRLVHVLWSAPSLIWIYHHSWLRRQRSHYLCNSCRFRTYGRRAEMKPSYSVLAAKMPVWNSLPRSDRSGYRHYSN